MGEDKTTGSQSDSTGFGWKEALKLVRPISPVSANFSATIRTMLSHYEQGAICLPPGAQTQILRLIKNNTVKATYYYASKEYRPSLLQTGQLVTPKSFLNGYTPADHATILAYCYLFRALAKRSDTEEWEYVQAPLYEALAVGACIGQSVPEVGFAFGMLSKGIRYLAFAPFLIADKKAFKEYRRHLRSKDLPYDAEREVSMWGCTNIQVAALLLELVGFNSAVTLQFVAAAERNSRVVPDQLYGIRFRVAEALLDLYMESGELPPTLPEWVGSGLTLSSNSRDDLIKALGKVISSTDRVEWLNKGSANVNVDSTPELFETTFAQPKEEAPAELP